VGKLTQIDDLMVFLNEYAIFLEDMIKVEQEKLSALVTNDLVRIEHSITEQQATAKQFENMERKRLVIQADAGYQDRTFSEIIEAVELEKKDQLQTTFNRIQKAISQIKFLNNKAMDVVKTNVSMQMSVSGQQAQQAYGYSKDQIETNSKHISLLEKKV
jgi:hypothetical protein